MREEIEKFRKENSENHWDLTILPILGAGGVNDSSSSNTSDN